MEWGACLGAVLLFGGLICYLALFVPSSQQGNKGEPTREGCL